MTHEVRVLCNCDDEPCKMEIYVSDVRIAVDDQVRLLLGVADVFIDRKPDTGADATKLLLQEITRLIDAREATVG